jgi:predicted DCC family thiol-disulfide oxidoreductase YuxK
LQAWGITARDAAQRLHVRKDGTVYGGIPAFIVLWQEIPQMRWLARIVALPGINWAAVKVYDHILAPLLYRWHVSRERRRQSASR